MRQATFRKGDRLTKDMRKKQRGEGMVSREPDNHIQRVRTFQKGDRVRFDPKFAVPRHGDVGKVTGIDRSASTSGTHGRRSRPLVIVRFPKCHPVRCVPDLLERVFSDTQADLQ